MKTRVITGTHILMELWLFLAVLVGATLGVPPRVIKTVPGNGAQDVEPKLRQIRVLFDQDMNQAGFSICGGGPQFPEIIGNPRWVNKRMIAMQVKLVPEHNYELSINCPGATNFKSIRGEAAVPYPLQFRTGQGKGTAKADTLTAADNSDAIKTLHRAIRENYSYHDLRRIQWGSLFAKYMAEMKQAKTPRQFAETAAELLAHAKDMHIWLELDNETIRPFRRNIKPNYNRDTLARIVPNWQKRSAAVYTGRFDDGIGYILIDSWSHQRAEALEQTYVAIWEYSDAPGLIIDVRPNGGGAEPLAQSFAGCFVAKPVVYAKHVYRMANQPGGFGKLNERILEPNKRQPKYRGKVAVLMGPANMSSCEAFLLMMKQVPGCRLIGETSYGSSGNPKPADLGNGVTVFLPSWKALRPNGTCFEGQGIKPDILVKTTQTEFLSRDPVLEAALKLLRKL